MSGRVFLRTLGQIPQFFIFYQQSVAAAHNAEAQAGAALGDVDGGLAPRDDGTGGRVADHGGGCGRAALALKQRRLRCDVRRRRKHSQRDGQNAERNTHWCLPLPPPLPLPLPPPPPPPLQDPGWWRLECWRGTSTWCPRKRHPGRLTEDGRKRKQSVGWTSLFTRQQLFVEFLSSYLLHAGALC